MLFHYKYYKSQQALNLTHNELELVLAAVYGTHGPETRLVADQIIIKLFMDVSQSRHSLTVRMDRIIRLK